MSSGQSDEDLDFASVQRDNAEMVIIKKTINTCINKTRIETYDDAGARLQMQPPE